MMQRRIGLALMVVAVFFMTWKAQAMDTLDLDLGDTSTRQTNAPAIHRFVAVSGTRINARVSAPGRVELTLYGPDGGELRSVGGSGAAMIDMPLGIDGFFYLTVALAGTEGTYDLTLLGTYPEVPAIAVPAKDPSVESSQGGINRTEADSPAYDPGIWGVYLQLVGSYAQRSDSGYRIHWRWVSPGEVLVEEWVDPTTGELKQTHTITPRGTPGELLLKASYFRGKEWFGTVQADGSVLYVGHGMLKSPYQVWINEANEFEQRLGKLRNGQLVDTYSASHLRFPIKTPSSL
jgi:hypothetical protein